MFGLRAPVITISVILNVVIVIICVMRGVTGDSLIEASGAVAEIGRGRGWSGWMSGGQRDGDDRSS